MWNLPVIWMSMFSSVAMANPSSNELRNGPHTISVVYDKPTQWVDQGRETWTLSITSDGVTAWAEATVATATPVYRVPGQPGYQEVDFTKEGRLIVWRRVKYASQYDLTAHTARTCDVQMSHHLGADGSDLIHGPSNTADTDDLENEMVWNLVWSAIGDASISNPGYVTRRTGEIAPGVEVATHGEVSIGVDWLLKVDVSSFSESFTPAVRDRATATLAGCPP